MEAKVTAQPARPVAADPTPLPRQGDHWPPPFANTEAFRGIYRVEAPIALVSSMAVSLPGTLPAGMPI